MDMKRIWFYILLLVLVVGCVGKGNEQSEGGESENVVDIEVFTNAVRGDEEVKTLLVTDRVEFRDMAEIFVQESEDGCLKAFSWDDSMGGTNRYYKNVYQIKSAGREYNIIASLDEIFASKSKDAMGVTREIILGDFVKNIKTIYVKGNKPVYLIETYNRFSSQDGLICVYAAQIKDNMLVPYPLFKGKPYASNSDLEKDIEEEYYVSIAYSKAADWYFNANFGEGWDWLITYTSKMKRMYVAQTNDEGYGELIDRYYIYEFDGEYYNYVGKGAGYWLHHSLHDYASLGITFATKDYRVRVDKMDDGGYRYASWNGGGDMSTSPNLVLYGGVCEEVGEGYSLIYIFTNDDCTYIVSNESLEVKQSGKTILKQKATES